MNKNLLLSIAIVTSLSWCTPMALAGPSYTLGVHHPPAPTSGFHAEAMESMKKMLAEMEKHHMNGDADHDFVHMMIPHHQSAIEMANALLRYGDDPEIRAMAQKMIEDQSLEIAAMKAWMERYMQSHGHEHPPMR